jgi:hypothetical protein
MPCGVFRALAIRAARARAKPALCGRLKKLFGHGSQESFFNRLGTMEL